MGHPMGHGEFDMNVIDPKIRVKLFGGSHSDESIVIGKGIETIRMIRKLDKNRLSLSGDTSVSNVTIEYEEYVVDARNNMAMEKGIYAHEMEDRFRW